MCYKAESTVLVASRESAIPGMLMYLFDVPPERINEVKIPAGLPLIYDPVSRRIRLLGDETASSPSTTSARVPSCSSSRVMRMMMTSASSWA